MIDLKGGRIAQEDGVQKHILFTEPRAGPMEEPNANSQGFTSDSDIGSGVARMGGDINCTST